MPQRLRRIRANPHNPQMAIFSLSNAHLAFGHVALLDNAAFSLGAGERLGLIGRNGAGKSSMLKVIAGLESSNDKIRKMFPSYWRGRQMADAIGMPYRTFLNIAFEKRLSYWSRPFMPNARHLYSEMIAVTAQERWEELQRARLFTSDLPAYLTQNYQNSDMQNDYHEWLFLQAQHRGNRAEFFIEQIEKDGLPLDKVLARVQADPDVTAEIKRRIIE